VKVEIYDREWLDENEYELTDILFQKFNLLNEDVWSQSESIGVAFQGNELVGVIVGYDEICIVCQVDENFRRQGIGTSLVQNSGMFAPKQNGAPEFWEAVN